MSSLAGPNYSTAAVNEPSEGDTAWTNVANGLVSDDSYATCVLSGGASNNLLLSGFNFNIDPNNVIAGIQVEVEGKTLTGDVDMRIRVRGDDYSSQEVDVWNVTESFRSYGGPNSLWGLNWTPADINSSTFGAAISTFTATDTVSVDSVRITVYYDSAEMYDSSPCGLM